uniref:NADH-ubiquinone oxidoreductase chain 2 n=1 Tax=Potamotyphlus kaupii TaxID=3372812 RepID=W5RHL5_9AMPH|nr:NADH dehydrogenase subunit 2 [Potomotyphlus kaupii]AGZ19074.1 NADH dehydrogenase subunit 2 [Potomotyphlus kaupii]
MSPRPAMIMLASLMLGTTLVLTSNHWLMVWVGLEINTLAIMPFLIQHHHPRATEATMKYFLTQAAAATLILFSALMNAWQSGQWFTTMLSSTPSNLITIALMMKLGLAPVHFWLPEVLQGASLTTGLILATWQKIAPMTLMMVIHANLNPHVLMTIGLTSILVGGWTGINQTQLRKILAYSSIAHMGWMMMILPLMPELALLNFVIYLTLTTPMFLTMKLINTTNIQTMTTSWTKATTAAALAMLTLLSLGGLPPTSGFIPKWLIMHELTKQGFSAIATMAAISALLSLFFYLRLGYTLTLTQSPNSTNSTTTWRHKSHNTPLLLPTTTVMALMLLPMTPTLF